MKTIEIINAEEEKLKNSVNEAIESFQEATGLKINSIVYSLTLSETLHIYYPKTVITYMAGRYEVYQNP
jgi:hypothetical protein